MHKMISDRTAKGPYSTAVQAGGFVFLSGQGGLDPATGQPVAKGIEGETRQTLINIGDLLSEAGLGYEDLVQVTCYLTDIDDWPKLNTVYAEVLGEKSRPTRTAVGVSQLPFGLSVEMTAIAFGAPTGPGE